MINICLSNLFTVGLSFRATCIIYNILHGWSRGQNSEQQNNAPRYKKQCSCRLSGSSENRAFKRCRSTGTLAVFDNFFNKYCLSSCGVSHGIYTVLIQERIKVFREVIPHIGPVPIIIPLKLFLDLPRDPVFP